MKLKQFLEKLNQLAKERPESLEMEVFHHPYTGNQIMEVKIDKMIIKETNYLEENKVFLIGWIPHKH